VHGARSLSIGGDRLHVAPWRGDASIAYVVARHGPTSTAAVAKCLDQLAARGYQAAITTALPLADQAPFASNGFTVRERLHLLSRPVDPVPELPDLPAGIELRRGRRRDRPRVLDVDGAAFPAFWRLDAAGLDDALSATPSSRFRVATTGADSQDTSGYAVTGRAGPRGYLQRLAVAPSAHRQGIGAALVVDALRWLRRWGGREVLVNTQEGNGGALALYERLGFRRQREGLVVLHRALTGPAS
jgi:ribosomal protein S18 acetylase RimI-like enzyme